MPIKTEQNKDVNAIKRNNAGRPFSGKMNRFNCTVEIVCHI